MQTTEALDLTGIFAALPDLSPSDRALIELRL